ncbi:MAG: hypothetical protein U0736_21820 [Gemmataceae bacterium]
MTSSFALVLLTAAGPLAADAPQKALPLPGEVFTVAGRVAFLIPAAHPAAAKPWVWYAPTLPGLPGPEERWMFERFRAAGVAVAGVDAGESYGSPAGTAFDALHRALTARGYPGAAGAVRPQPRRLMALSWRPPTPTGSAGSPASTRCAI